jgi:hypothetical protein
LELGYSERRSDNFFAAWSGVIKYIGIGECFDFNIIGEDYVYKG